MRTTNSNLNGSMGIRWLTRECFVPMIIEEDRRDQSVENTRKNRNVSESEKSNKARGIMKNVSYAEIVNKKR
jgi:hypothetical protein